MLFFFVSKFAPILHLFFAKIIIFDIKNKLRRRLRYKRFAKSFYVDRNIMPPACAALARQFRTVRRRKPEALRYGVRWSKLGKRFVVPLTKPTDITDRVVTVSAKYYLRLDKTIIRQKVINYAIKKSTIHQ